MARGLSFAAVFWISVCVLSAQGSQVPSAPAPAGGAVQGRGVGPGRGTAPPARGPVRDPREQTAGTGVIRGRIVTVDTGAPVRRAQVRASSSASRGARLAITDAQGQYEFRDLPAGRWDVSASKAGFVTMRYGQRRPFEGGTPIELSDGQVLDRADFFLPRGAAITGRIYDEFGEPVAGARVQALRYQVVQGTRRLMPVGTTSQSDDTGAFRLFGLMPGDYYVSAVVRALLVDDPNDVSAYAPTYYPGTGSVQDAQRISLSVAEETSISFALVPVRISTISGRVIGSSGIPLATGNVLLVAADAAAGPAAAVGNAARIRPDGSFTISNVPPGSYSAVATSDVRRAGGGEVEMGSLPVSVAGEDLTGIAIVTSRGATLAGTVTVAPDSTMKTRPTGLQVSAQATPPDVQGAGGRIGGGRVDAQGTFQLTNLFGTRLIRVAGLPQGWALQSVLAGGRDVTDTPLEFSTGGAVRDVQIVVTDRLTEVNGSVVTSAGLTRDYSIVIFPEDESKWVFPSRHVRAARPDQRGVFTVRGMPPGDRYLAVALDYLEEGEAADPAFLEQLRTRSTRFTLATGESTTLELKLIER